ncbi:MAG: hypothetical protein HY817_01505 [Candidatus Abawacabacteria bacterium]|nr:hypothetical protein [Candidatus Abawacabacteria bacterium]
MAKKSDYLFEAQRLYVTLGYTFVEIAQVVPVSDRSLRDWAKEGNWAEKRQGFLKEQYSLHEDIHRIIRKLITSIDGDIEAGIEPSQSRIRFLGQLRAMLPKVKTYEDSIKQAVKPEEKPEYSEDYLVDLMRKGTLNL